MRVATASFYQGIKQRLMSLSADLNKINEKVSSGKNFSRVSDDPISAMSAAGFRKALSQIEQYQTNGKIGNTWLSLSETVISHVVDVVDKAREIAIQLGSGTQTEEARVAAAKVVGGLLDDVISSGNTQFNGNYIFAGYQTKTAPFSKATVGGIDTAQYNGDTNNFQIQIGMNQTMTVGNNGQTVFMDSSLFDTLGTLKKALEDNDPDTIQQQVDNLNSARDYLNNQLGDVGIREYGLQKKQEILSSLNSQMKGFLSNIEDADETELAVELNAQQTAYQTALLASSKIMQLNLTNYLT
jgi:flagellar hook-associated protein 3 FlgL